MNWRKSLRVMFSIWTLGTFLIICLPAIFWISSEMLDLRRSFADSLSGQKASDIKNRTIQRMKSDLSSCFQLAESPAVRSWLKNEFDPRARDLAFGTFDAFSKNMENNPAVYAVVSSSLRYYLKNEYQSLISKKNPVDDWYFRTISRPERFMLDIDYDPGLDLTRFWINVPVHETAGDAGSAARYNDTLGVVGTGLDISVFLKTMLRIEDTNRDEEKKLKNAFIAFFNSRGIIMAYQNVNCINRTSIFSLLDIPNERTALSNLMTTVRNSESVSNTPPSLPLEHHGTQFHASLVWIPMIDWYALVFIDTSELISFDRFAPLIAIISAALVTLFLAMLFFTNNRLIKPIVRLSAIMTRMQGGDLEVRAEATGHDEIGELALACNAMADEIKGYTSRLEEMVRKRTEELVRKNHEMVDSISYARLIQSGMLPKRSRISHRISDHSIIWRPRDIVSGDFYWFKEVEDILYLAVVDCTGHGVPGAFMTMTANAVLDHVIWYLNDDPAAMLMELDRLMRTTLNQDDASDAQSNDGLDIALVMIQPEKHSFVYSGARIPLFFMHKGKVEMVRGDRQSIGYTNSEQVLSFTAHEINYVPGDRLFISTDGLFDQTGGDRAKPFGTTRFSELILETAGLDLEGQRNRILMELDTHAGGGGQLDDITVFALALP
ncbi:MAG TPA: SpoIIE family protein phosphatase [Spirochaetota bacterium]|nr:SpoIIE family protein phosphatase [Spirochaetota bacterium]